MPLCKFGCDELFENGYISVQNGSLVSLQKTHSSEELENHISRIVGNMRRNFNENSE